MSGSFFANGRHYALPSVSSVLICLDGSADEYFDVGLARGLLPNFRRMAEEGFRGKVRGSLPSFTNVNNASIVTGVPPAVHGISGNYFLDPVTQQEVMMNSSRFLRCETLLAAAAKAGARVAFVTAKDKLREIFSADLEGISFSAERARDATMECNGIERVESLVGAALPPIYSAEASLFVLRAGVELVRGGHANLLYLSTTDYMQHKFDYDDPQVVHFYEQVDSHVGQLLEAGAVVGVTADHGMNAKQNLDGTPNVVYLESELRPIFGENLRVILPITDPYVAHHGALGSFAVIHLPEGVEPEFVIQILMKVPGITEVLSSSVAAEKLELPFDRIGDVVVMSGRNVVLGKSIEHHDLSQLASGLRSHGGRYEEMVPLFLSRPLSGGYRRKASGDPRNFDAFDFLLNGAGE